MAGNRHIEGNSAAHLKASAVGGISNCHYS